MRLKADQPEARKVKDVLLDGKPVPMVHEFDTDEGWISSYVVSLPDQLAANGEEVVEDDEAQMAGFTLVKRTGKVEVKFHDSDVDNRRNKQEGKAKETRG